MSALPIPAIWRNAVCAALRHRLFETTHDFWEAWQDDFPSASFPELIDDFEQMLSASLQGCPVTLDPPAKAGETWEFWFIHKNEKAYGKILLRKDGKGAVLYSAHLPRYRCLKCERPKSK